MPRRPSLTMPERAAPPPKPEPPKSYRAATRVGRRAVTFFLDEADYLELQLSSKRMNTTIQALGEEWFDRWARENAIKRTGAGER